MYLLFMLSTRFVFLINRNEVRHNSSKYKAFALPLTPSIGVGKTAKYINITLNTVLLKREKTLESSKGRGIILRHPVRNCSFKLAIICLQLYMADNKWLT